ncbi:MAG: T9SS type A sorting domain-containing protein [Bacteroidota bacterium]
MKKFTLMLSVVLAGLLLLVTSTTLQAQQQCCCATVGCITSPLSSCDAWCMNFGGNEGTDAPYPSPGDCVTACVLPIELVYFEAEKSNDGVQLAWETATEIENAGFEIQRMSGVKMDWEAIGFVEGNGTTYEAMEYYFLDDTPPPGMNYYRLAQVDYDGTSSFSSVKSVEKGDGQGLKLWPTIAKDHIMFGFNNQENFDNVQVMVVDMMGRTIISNQGFGDNYLDLQNLSEGQYLLNVYVNGVRYTERFVKVQ